MGIPTATKIAIIATCSPTHVLTTALLIINFFNLKNNKQINTRNKSAYGLDIFNTSFRQKTSWVEGHCYELLHGNKTTEMNILTIIYTLNNKNNHTNTLPAFYIPFKTGDSNCFAPSCFCSLKTRYVTVPTPTKPSCFHRFFNIGLLPERVVLSAP